MQAAWTAVGSLMAMTLRALIKKGATPSALHCTAFLTTTGAAEVDATGGKLRSMADEIKKQSQNFAGWLDPAPGSRR